MLQMTRSEYDLVITTQIKATTNMGGQTATKEKHMKDKRTPTIICMKDRR